MEQYEKRFSKVSRPLKMCGLSPLASFYFDRLTFTDFYLDFYFDRPTIDRYIDRFIDRYRAVDTTYSKQDPQLLYRGLHHCTTVTRTPVEQFDFVISKQFFSAIDAI